MVPLHHNLAALGGGLLRRMVQRRMRRLGAVHQLHKNDPDQRLAALADAEARIMDRIQGSLTAHATVDLKVALIIGVVITIVLANLLKDGQGLLSPFWMFFVCILGLLATGFSFTVLWPRLEGIDKLQPGDVLAQELAPIETRLTRLDHLAVTLHNITGIKGKFTKPAIIFGGGATAIALFGIAADSFLSWFASLGWL